MPKNNEEIRKSIKAYEDALPESERNTNVEQDVKSVIARASQPLQSKPGKPRQSGGYSGKRTRSRTAGDTSD